MMVTKFCTCHRSCVPAAYKKSIDVYYSFQWICFERKKIISELCFCVTCERILNINIKTNRPCVNKSYNEKHEKNRITWHCVDYGFRWLISPCNKRFKMYKNKIHKITLIYARILWVCAIWDIRLTLTLNSNVAISRSSIISVSVVLIQAQIKENIKAPHHWPLCEEFTGNRWIPRTKGQ